MGNLSFKDSNDMICIVKAVDTSSSFYKNKEHRIAIERLDTDIIAFSESKDITTGYTRAVALKKPEVVGYTTVVDAQIVLTQSKIKEMLPILQHFAETGELLFATKDDEDLILWENCDLIVTGNFDDCRNCYRYDICKKAKIKEIIDE